MQSLTSECPVCSNKSFVEKFPNTQELNNWKFNGIQYYYIECINCGIIKAHPLPTSETLKSYYNESYNYGSFKSEAFWKRLHSNLRIRFLSPYLKEKFKILDFGCGHGYFVKEASKAYQSFGFDIGAQKINNSKEGSITYSYDFKTYNEKDFDLITAWHVIEHLPNPLEVILELKNRLKPNGILAIAVPNIESLGFKLCAEKWNWVQPPLSHIYHYKAKNLCDLLINAGFEIVDVKSRDSLSNNFFDILVTKLLFRNKSRGSVNISLSRVNSPFYYHLANVLRCMFIPLSIFTYFIPNSGSELRVVARNTNFKIGK